MTILNVECIFKFYENGVSKKKWCKSQQYSTCNANEIGLSQNPIHIPQSRGGNYNFGCAYLSLLVI